VLQDEELARDKVDFEQHLVRHRVHVAVVDADASIEKPR
jgi:hypothetical protein